MRCVACDAAEVSERPDHKARGYRRFRYHACGKQFNERSDRILNRAPGIRPMSSRSWCWRLHYKLIRVYAQWRGSSRFSFAKLDAAARAVAAPAAPARPGGAALKARNVRNGSTSAVRARR
jgi:hypothetical protein